MFPPASATTVRVITTMRIVTVDIAFPVRSAWARVRLRTTSTYVRVTKGGAKALRIERVEDGYMAYVGNLSRHFATLHEAVLWAEYVCNNQCKDR